MLLERHGSHGHILLSAITAVVASVRHGEKTAVKRPGVRIQLVRRRERPYIGAESARQELKMAVRSLRNVEKQKKKARRSLPRKKLSRSQGNTLRGRRQLKKMAGKARAAKAAAAKA
jgi:hypothetical protein